MPDKVDASQWLPRGASIINERRAAKNDLDGSVQHGKITSARVVDETVAGNLVKRGFIEQCHLDYGLDFMELRNALYGALDTKTNFSIFLTKEDSRLTRSAAQEVYEIVAKELKRSGEKIIQHACTSSYEKDKAAKLIEGITVYVNMFNRLEKAMDSAINEIRKKRLA